MKYSYNLNSSDYPSSSSSFDILAEPIDDIHNRSVLSYVFGFHNCENEYQPILVIFSIMAIIPVVGGMFNIFASAEKSSMDFIYHSRVSHERAITCGVLVFLRMILSCLGLGLLFFLLDLIYILGCYIARKIK